ncbi:RNA-directed DNA polymerase from mobile element jockey [Trichonephila clavipes]|nr:RNA-directed DNA polymerase from mobile element jockey [Trichonephila clavipes]
MAYSDFEKAEAFKDTLEVTFQENEEPYCDDKIEEVESLGSVLSPYLYNIYTHDFPQHSTVSTCLFADDSAVLSQGVQLKYTIKNIQHFLDKLETWLTHWRIAINVDKSQAIIFRKWGVIDPPIQLTLFDDYIQWVPVVKYLGLHIDSRLTFKKHIDYLSEKFWGRISLAISLVGRRSPLSLENKVILYKQILRPVITYGSPVWGAAAATHMKKIQVIQNKILCVMTNAPCLLLLDRFRITLPSFAAVGTLSDIAACFFAAVGLLMDVAACLYSPAVEMLPLFVTSVWSRAVLMSPPLQAAGSSLPPSFQASLIAITARISRLR